MGGGYGTQDGLTPKLAPYTLLSPILFSKERLDKHMESIILATEWTIEVAQLEAYNKAGIGKNRKKLHSEGLRRKHSTCTSS